MKKGATKPVAAIVGYNAANDKGALDPECGLARGATYTAAVAAGAKDLAGNPLAQSRTRTFAVTR